MTATRDDRDWPVVRLHLGAPTTYADNETYEATLLELARGDRPGALLLTSAAEDGPPERGLTKRKMAFLIEHRDELAAGLAAVAYVPRAEERAEVHQRFDVMRERRQQVFSTPHEIIDDEEAALTWLAQRVAAHAAAS